MMPPELRLPRITAASGLTLTTIDGFPPRTRLSATEAVAPVNSTAGAASSG